MAPRKEKSKPRAKSKPKSVWSKIWNTLFPCMLQSEGRKGRKKPSRESTRKSSAESSKCKDRNNRPFKTHRATFHEQPSKNRLEKNRPLISHEEHMEVSQREKRKHIQPRPRQNNAGLNVAFNNVPELYVPTTNIKSSYVQSHDPQFKYSPSDLEINENNDTVAAHSVLAPKHSLHPLHPPQEGQYPTVGDETIGDNTISTPNKSSVAVPAQTSNVVNHETQEIHGLGISNLGFENIIHQTSSQPLAFSEEEYERYLSPSPAPSETGATVGGYEGIPKSFNSIPCRRKAVPRVPVACLMWCAPAPAPTPPDETPQRSPRMSSRPSVEMLNDSDGSLAESQTTLTKSSSETSSASSLPKEIYSSYQYQPYQEIPQADGLTIGSSAVEPGGILPNSHNVPVPDLMASIAMYDHEVINALQAVTEIKTHSTSSRKRSARRKQTRRAIDIDGNGNIIRKDVKGKLSVTNRHNLKVGTVKQTKETSNRGQKMKQSSDSCNTEQHNTDQVYVMEGKDPNICGGNAESAGGATTREGRKGSIQWGNTSKNGNRKIRRTRAEMQPTVESVNSSVVGNQGIGT